MANEKMKINPVTGKLDIVGPDGIVGPSGPPGPSLSMPPANCFKVTNIYVDNNGKLVIEYDDTPTP